MKFSLDSYFGVHQQSLVLRSQRNTAIANNLANADTPGFKARDYDFRTVLAQAGGEVAPGERVRVTNVRHLGGGGGPSDPGPLLYRVPMQPAQDGNTVEQDTEQAAFAENAVRYQASLQFLSNRISAMVDALRGGAN